jgi:hypothetical protein
MRVVEGVPIKAASDPADEYGVDLVSLPFEYSPRPMSGPAASRTVEPSLHNTSTPAHQLQQNLPMGMELAW